MSGFGFLVEGLGSRRCPSRPYLEGVLTYDAAIARLKPEELVGLYICANHT